MTRVLDVLEDIIAGHLGLAFARLDGATPATERLALVDRFNSDPAVRVFLLSTRSAQAPCVSSEGGTVGGCLHPRQPSLLPHAGPAGLAST